MQLRFDVNGGERLRMVKEALFRNAQTSSPIYTKRRAEDVKKGNPFYGIVCFVNLA